MINSPRKALSLAKAFGPNDPRLVKLKNSCDPINLFRLNANIKPKV